MPLYALDGSEVERLRNLLTAFESGRLNRDVRPFPEYRNPPLETWVGQTNAYFPAMTGVTPSSGQATIWNLFQGNLIQSDQTYTVYNLWDYDIGPGQFVMLNREPSSGYLFIIGTCCTVPSSASSSSSSSVSSSLISSSYVSSSSLSSCPDMTCLVVGTSSSSLSSATSHKSCRACCRPPAGVDDKFVHCARIAVIFPALAPPNPPFPPTGQQCVATLPLDEPSDVPVFNCAVTACPQICDGSTEWLLDLVDQDDARSICRWAGPGPTLCGIGPTTLEFWSDMGAFPGTGELQWYDQYHLQMGGWEAFGLPCIGNIVNWVYLPYNACPHCVSPFTNICTIFYAAIQARD